MTQGSWKLLVLSLVALLFSACASFPTDTERLARVEQLVERQEFAKAEKLLANIEPTDPQYQDLLIRRRALRPLIVQFEENLLRQLNRLKEADRWPTAEATLREALDKLPDSEALQLAQKRLYADREERLEQIEREMALLHGQLLAAKAPLVRQAEQVNPGSVKTRWRAFQHDREAAQLARELLACGEKAMNDARYDLAQSCLDMAATLTDDEEVASQVARLEKQREEEKARAAARQQEQRQAEQSARLARQREQVKTLKARYRSLFDAGWWMAAKEILGQLRHEVPDDPDVATWTSELQSVIQKQVSRSIERGQALYTEGQLHDALAVWRSAARLDPENTVLQAHIARVERFIHKLERLDEDA